MPNIDKLTDFVLAYPNFQLGQIIDPEQANLNNLQFTNKINLIIKEFNKLSGNDASFVNGEIIVLPTIQNFESKPLVAMIDEIITCMKNSSGSSFIGAVDPYTNTVTNLQAILTELKNAIEGNSEGDRAYADSLIASFNTVISNLETRDGELNTSIEELNTTLQNFNSSLESLRQTVANNKTIADATQRQLDDLETVVVSYDGRITSCEDVVNSSNTRFEEVNTAINEHSVRINTVEEDVANINLSVTSNTNKINEFETSFTSVKDGLESLNNSETRSITFATPDERIESLETLVATNTANITALQNNSSDLPVTINLTNFERRQFVASGGETTIPLLSNEKKDITVFQLYFNGCKLAYDREFFVTDDYIQLQFSLSNGDIIDIEKFDAVEFVAEEVKEFNKQMLNSTSLEYELYNNTAFVNKCYESQFTKASFNGRTIKRVFSDGAYLTVNFSSSASSGTRYGVNNDIPIDFNKRYFIVYDVINNTMPNSYYIAKSSVSTQFSSSNLISAGKTGLFVAELSMKTDKKYGYYIVSIASGTCTTGSITYRREVYECPAEYTLEDFNSTYKFDFPSESIVAQDSDWVTVTRDSTNPNATSKLAIPEVTANKKFILLVDIAENTMNKNYVFCNLFDGYPFKYGAEVIAKSIGSYRFIIETLSDVSEVILWELISQTTNNMCQGSITFKRTLVDYDAYVNTRYNPAGFVCTPNTLYINNNSFTIPYELNGITTFDDDFYDEFVINEDGSGEYIQRIGKFVVKGDSNIVLNTNATELTNTIAWQIKKNVANMVIKYADNADSFETLALKFLSGSENTFLNEDFVQIGVYNGCICGRLLRSELTSEDANGIKSYFTSNPTTVYYVMKTPTVTHIPYESMPIYKIQNGSNCFKFPGNLNCKAKFRITSDVGSHVKSLEARISELETMVMQLSSTI